MACIFISRQLMDTHRHFPRGFIRKCSAENMTGKDTKLIHKVCESMRQSTRLSAPCTCDHTHHTLCRRHSFFLPLIEPCQYILHRSLPPCE